MAAHQQLLDKMRADKACAACHENTHVPRSSTTKHTECTKKMMIGIVGRVCQSRKHSGFAKSPTVQKLCQCSSK